MSALRLALAACAALLLAGCNCDDGKTEPVTVAPDGTKLWRACTESKWVYFSVAGTHTTHSERHGKTQVTVDDDVPAARP